MNGRNGICIQFFCDSPEGLLSLLAFPNALDDDIIDKEGASQPHTLPLPYGQSVAGPLPDQTPLKLSEGRHDIGDHLPGWCRGVDAEVDGNESPPTGTRILHGPGEVEERPRQPVQLGHDEGARYTASDGFQGVGEGRTACQSLTARSGVLKDLDKVPAPEHRSSDSPAIVVASIMRASAKVSCREQHLGARETSAVHDSQQLGVGAAMTKVCAG